MPRIVFVHGMFQNPVSWDQWLPYFDRLGYDCTAPAWPLHDGDPATLRADPPAGLGELRLADILGAMRAAAGADRPIMVGHSVGGLVTQVLLDEGLLSAGVAICPVAPNAMVEFDWGFLKNSAIIANPLKGDAIAPMDEKTFHGAFANTLSARDAALAFARTATHDSRNVFRDCLGEDGRVDLARPHAPLLLVGAQEDQITPVELIEKNAQAYASDAGIVGFRAFPGRSHFICGEPGWEEVANYVAKWLIQIGDPLRATG